MMNANCRGTNWHVSKITTFLALCLFCVLICFMLKSNSYASKKAKEEWRKKAEERIEKIRKADVVVSVRNCEKAPMARVNVGIRMKRHAFAFGSAVSAKELMGSGGNSTEYRKKVLKLFNKVVLENDLKHWPWVHGKKSPKGSRYNLEQTFAALKWLDKQNIPVRGHRIINCTFGYYKKNGLRKNQPEALREFIFSHVQDKVTSVGDLVTEWDVLNHPVSTANNLGNIFGTQIYVDVLKQTKQLNKNVKLYINEGHILTSKDTQINRNAYDRLIQYFVAHGATIDGIGFMGHFRKQTLTPPKKVLEILDRFAKFGLPLQITEFDILFGKKYEKCVLSSEELQIQADYTRDYITAMFSHPSVEGVIMWGFWEGRHWFPGAALYRMDWSIKPNGQVWKDLVFKKWWTDVKCRTDNNGKCKTRGFLGDYEIEVRHKDKIKRVPVILSKIGQHIDITICNGKIKIQTKNIK